MRSLRSFGAASHPGGPPHRGLGVWAAWVREKPFCIGCASGHNGVLRAEPEKTLAIKSSTGGFYDKVKETTRVIVFDDFAPEGKGTAEYPWRPHSILITPQGSPHL